jgi:peptidyl-dipeptidase A
VSGNVSAASLVEEIGSRLEPLEAAANRAWWDANTDASEANQTRRAETDLALSNALADTDAFAAVHSARAAGTGDPLTRRQLDVLEQAFVPHQVEPALRKQIVDLGADIESRFARFRGTLDGAAVDDNAILQVLRTSADSGLRKRAWEASKEIGAEVASDVRQLVRLRNDAARGLGYRDHFALSLETTDFDEMRLFATLDEVDRITAEPFRALKTRLDAQIAEMYGIDTADIGPWHYEDPFFQDAPRAVSIDLDEFVEGQALDALTIDTFARMGLDVVPVLGRSDLLPRDGKNQHAFCIDVDRSGDVRVLSNNTPSERWAETMLHEFGHAVYFDGVARDLPWLLRTMPMCVTEGVAMRCGRLVREPEWLERVAGVPSTTVSDLAPKLRAARRAQLLVFARWVLVMTHFERGLYTQPDAAHDDRWWDLVERFQLVTRPPGRRAPDWAAKVHIAIAPVYYHNYLFGELIASQLSATLGSLVDHTDAGRALSSRLFAPGAQNRWDRLIADATGSELSPAALARDIAA